MIGRKDVKRAEMSVVGKSPRSKASMTQMQVIRKATGKETKDLKLTVSQARAKIEKLYEMRGEK